MSEALRHQSSTQDIESFSRVYQYPDSILAFLPSLRFDCFASSPKEKGDGYVANGEIGIVVGDAYKAGNKPRWTKVQFASQPDLTYGFSGRDFSEEGSPILELAYAVTVHKAQGSDFSKVFLVLPSLIPSFFETEESEAGGIRMKRIGAAYRACFRWI